MQKPNIIELPTSQMMALCDALRLGNEVQESPESMIVALEAADFSELKVVKPVIGEPRPANAVGFKPEKVSADIVARRKAKLGR